MGPDGIQPSVLKELTNHIMGPLHVIFQWFWEPGKVSVDWELANVVPVFKKTKKEEFGNYRPMSFTAW